MTLTAQTARTFSLPPGKTDHIVFDPGLGGFGLRLRQGAKGVTRTWLYQYNIGPRTRRITIGDASSLPASEARRTAARLQSEVRLGGDPAAKKTAAREEAATTMAGVLETYLPIKKAKLRPRSYVETERHLLVGFKRLHHHPVRLISTAMVTAQYEAMVAERGATTATNAWRALHAFFDWCVRQNLIDRNPGMGVERRKVRARTRRLSPEEIRALWQATAGDDEFSAIVRLLLLTGPRANEIGSLRWSEVQADRIELAPERTKSGRAHVIPITPIVRAILDRLPRKSDRDFVFGRMPERPFSGWSAGKEALDARLKIAPWCIHDLRRTLASELGEMVAPHIVSAILNHAPAGVTAKHYNFAVLREPVRNALLAWDARVSEIVEDRAPRDDRRVLRMRK